MTQKKNPSTVATPTTTAPTSASFDVFRKPKDERRTALTHEKIADDLAAFQRSGGKIEVLGTTYTLKSIPPSIPASVAPVQSNAPAEHGIEASEAGTVPSE
jgi:hypothetical protein